MALSQIPLGGLGGVGAGIATGGLSTVASSLMAKKPAPIDISQQLSAVQNNAMTNQGISNNLYSSLQPGTANFSTGANAITSGAATGAQGAAAGLASNVAQNTQAAKDALRSNPYSSTFNGLPSALEATREASAAGGGVQGGAYQKAVQQIGQGTAQTLAQGEAGIQAQGAQAQNAAATTAYQTVQNTLNNLTQDQLSTLNTAFQSGRQDLIQNAATQMGLNDQETQSLVDLYNFQQSGNMASTLGTNQSNQQLLGGIINAGAKIATA
jgi:hypothetical protein